LTELNSILGSSSEKYEYLINNIVDVIVEIDLKGTFSYISPQVYNIFGYKPKEIIGTKFFNYIHPDDMPSIIEAFENAINSEASVSLEYRVKHKEGYYINISASGSLVKIDENVKIIGVLKNITERKLAERKLKESEKKFKLLYENAPLPYQSLDAKGNILDVNKAWLEFFGYEKEEVIGRWLGDFLASSYKERLKSRFSQFKEEGEVQEVQYEAITKEGTHKIISFNGKVGYNENGEFERTHCIFKDITERIKFEKEIEEINRLKSELLERTSHELKTPLISIKGFTDLLLDLHKEKFDAETVLILDEIKQGTEQLEMIINNLLETSHLASGKLEFKPIQDDLSFLIKFSAKNLRGLANTRKHFISLDIPEKLIVKFEKEKLYEVISHLIINAIKYTPLYGEIKIRSEVIDDLVIVSIEDNGIGITEDEKKKIFKQFGKIERYGQGWDIGIEGTGMGLYTSKKIVELHGGKIWVESEGRNMGSKFCFSLPYEDE
jgi:PAS domain S-box-containing protein